MAPLIGCCALESGCDVILVCSQSLSSQCPPCVSALALVSADDMEPPAVAPNTQVPRRHHVEVQSPASPPLMTREANN